MINVSVVISTYNALSRLKNCLYALTLQDYPFSQFEVIVIDDHSVDGTENYMKDVSFPFRLIYKRNETNKGRSLTRNAGISLAQGEVILFSDCDMIMPPSFIGQHMRWHTDSQSVVVCGSFWHQISEKTPLSEESIRISHYLHFVKEQTWAYWFKQFVQSYGTELREFYFPWMYFVVMNVSVRREHVVSAGGFDEAFTGYGGEDEEFGYRLFKNGLSFVMDESLKNYHQEHYRSSLQANESQANVDYIVKKHNTLDVLLFYSFHEQDHFFKNNVLKEVYQLVRADNHQEFLKELQIFFSHMSRATYYRPSKLFLHAVQSLSPSCPNLEIMIKKWLITQRKKRFR